MRKAIVGAGYDIGLAEDVSRASGWLCANGIDGATLLFDALGKTVIIPKVSVSPNSISSFKDVCILSCGPSVIDILVSDFKQNTEEKSQIHLSNIDAPFLLIGLAANAMRDYRVTIEILFSSGEIIMLSPSSVNLNAVAPQSGVDAVLKCSLPKLSNQQEGIPIKDEKKSILISEKSVQLLDTLAAKTYVPASEASRLAGAGAGLTDND